MAKNTRSLTTELGTSGTLITHGTIVAEEYNARLRNRNQRLMLYDIMSRSDPDVHGVLEVVKLPILAATPRIVPPNNPDGKVDPKDREIADHLEHELFHDDIDFSALTDEALDMLDMGFSVCEKVLKLKEYNGRTLWGIDKLAFRKQTTIQYWQMSDGSPGITQLLGNQHFETPMEKLIVFVNKRRGDNYEGTSLLRYVYRDWDMKDKLTLVNAIALEKMAVGVPMIREDPASSTQANPTDMEKAEAALEEFRANEKNYLKTPRGILIEMLDMKSSTTKDVLPTLAMHKRAIFSSVLATFLDLGGSSGSGAKSLSKDLTSFFMKSEEYIARTVAAAINQQLIKQLCDLNYTDLPNGYPQLTYGAIGDDDIEVLSTAINNLMTAGALTADSEMEDAIRTKVGLPAMPEDIKKNYVKNQELKQKAAEALANPDTTPADTKDTKKPPKSKDTTKAAIDATRDAQKRIIEVIFADED